MIVTTKNHIVVDDSFIVASHIIPTNAQTSSEQHNMSTHKLENQAKNVHNKPAMYKQSNEARTSQCHSYCHYCYCRCIVIVINCYCYN